MLTAAFNGFAFNAVAFNAAISSSGVIPLVIPLALYSVAITTPINPSPWTIDPERTQQLATSIDPTPWTIDPERTQELN